jgi:nucleotide-binding universal stress UspA family protein
MTPDMKQILVATDFSSGAANALEYALELAKVLHQEVCVLHAVGSLEGVNNNTYNALYIEDYQNSKREALRAWVANITAQDRFVGMQVTTRVDVGSVSSSIVRYAEEQPVALIVMGASGSTGISGLFGSNTSSVIIKTTTPVLIIPPESTFQARPVITLASDYESKLSAGDVEGLNELIKAFGTDKLHVLNVVEKSDPAALTAGEEALKKVVTGTDLVFNYLTDTDPTNGILNFIESSQTDILCVVRHHHNVIYRIFTRSTVNRVLNRSIKAVLVLHE